MVLRLQRTALEAMLQRNRLAGTQLDADDERRGRRLVLEKVWGADTQKNLSIAKAFVREVAEKHPQIIDFLDQTGLGNSSGVIIGLYHQAERLTARNGDQL